MVVIVHYIDIRFRGGVIGISIGFEKVIKGGGHRNFDRGRPGVLHPPPPKSIGLPPLTPHFKINIKCIFIILCYIYREEALFI